MDWLLGWINEVDSLLVNFVYRRRGPAFIYWATKPDQWDDFMAELEAVRYRIVYRNEDGTINRHWMDTYSSETADKMVTYMNQELYDMLYQMERVIVTARKYPDLMDTSLMSGRNTVAGKLAHELHALEQLPQYQEFTKSVGLWEQIWERTTGTASKPAQPQVSP